MQVIQNEDEVTAVNDAGEKFLQINPGLQSYAMGDLNGSGNGTHVKVNDRPGEQSVDINASILHLPAISQDARNEITSKRKGALIFNTDSNKFQGWNGTAWIDLH